MSTRLDLRSAPAPVRGVMVARDVHRFDLLVADMEAELGDAWADLSVADATAFLSRAHVDPPKFLAVALGDADTPHLGALGKLVATAIGRGIPVVLVTDQIPADSLKTLLRLGASHVLPYPLAAGALRETIRQICAPGMPLRPDSKGLTTSSDTPRNPRPTLPRQAAVFAVHALAGGTGASTLAANMAWEMATIDKHSPPSVCLLDLDLQRATMSAYLDLPRRDMVADLLQDAASTDVEGFKQALAGFGGHLSVLPAPTEMVPLDIIGPSEVQALLDLAGQCFDVIVIDMPQSLVMWSETVLNRADIYFATLELDMRSAQNVLRFKRALEAENLPGEKLHFVLNRAPRLTDLAGRARVHKMCQTLDITIATHLPDGGKAVRDACDNGIPLAEAARKNPLRRDIQKLCQRLYKTMLNDIAMAS